MINKKSDKTLVKIEIKNLNSKKENAIYLVTKRTQDTY